jgi:GNAT superfamily N-acetyltransferase
MNVVIRDATPQDRDVVVRFNKELASETEDLQLDPAVLGPGVDALLGDPAKGRYYLASVDGQVVGQLATTFEWSDWRNGMFLWIQSVYVEASHRGQGVFTALYQHVQALAAQPGYCGVRLYVFHENTKARSLYEKLGMVDHGYSLLETPDHLRE